MAASSKPSSKESAKKTTEIEEREKNRTVLASMDTAAHQVEG
jgi:hypothetical protein